MRRVRILRIITRLNTGGPARHLAALTQALDRERYEQKLAAGREGRERARCDPWSKRKASRSSKPHDQFTMFSSLSSSSDCTADGTQNERSRHRPGFVREAGRQLILASPTAIN
jgi:hypothetical protein